MRAVDIHTLRGQEKTRTWHEWNKLVGHKPDLANKTVMLNPELTMLHVTEMLQNVKEIPKAKANKGIKSPFHEWFIQTHNIPKIRIVESCNETGEGAAIFPIIVDEAYFNPNDMLKMENEQVLFVVGSPEILAPKKVRYYVQLADNDATMKANTKELAAGKTLKWHGIAHPELSERGYSRAMYNIEKHRVNLTLQRVTKSQSAEFAATEDYTMEHAGIYFKMPKIEKEVAENFNYARETMLLFGKSTFDEKGNSLLQTSDGRSIWAGDGFISQIQRFCEQLRYTVFTRKLLDNAINIVRAKSPSSTGLKIVCMCNYRFYDQFGELADTLLKDRANGSSYFFNKNGDKVTLGAEFVAYKWQGNEVIFNVNKVLDMEYPEYGYAIFFDTSKYDGEPNVQMLTIDGMSLIRSELNGVGGKDGKSSGQVSTLVAGSTIDYYGWHGIKVANPYAACIIKENRIF